jgi:peptide-methionine (R)-S-oxide reductase
MTETAQTPRLSPAGFDLTPPSKADLTRLEAGLTQEEKDVLLHHGTEAPFCGGLLDNKEGGVYCCRLCGLPLFQAKTKFESGTGWPSFNDPEPDAVESSTDSSWGMMRTEVHCSRCGSHLGHVFEDGPPPTNLRYCINGVAMDFKPE